MRATLPQGDEQRKEAHWSTRLFRTRSPGSWPSTVWVPDLRPTSTDPRRATSLYRSRADLAPFAHDGSLENVERWPASTRFSPEGRRRTAAPGVREALGSLFRVPRPQAIGSPFSVFFRAGPTRPRPDAPRNSEQLVDGSRIVLIRELERCDEHPEVPIGYISAQVRP